MLRKARPDDAFWRLWRSDKSAMKAAGISLTRDQKEPGAWLACWWQPLDGATVKQEETRREESRAMTADIDVPVPDGMVPRPFQLACVKFTLDTWAKGKGVLIGDEMGCGKTIETVLAINAEPKISRVLILCPNGLKLNWQQELTKWLARPFSIGIGGADCFPSTDIMILNYDSLRKYRNKLTNMWDLLVCDEAHLLKNPQSIRSQIVLGHRATKKEVNRGVLSTTGIPARRVALLTGTPIPNRTIEAFPLLNRCDPVTFSNYFKFAMRYAGANQNGYGGHWDFSGATNLEELQQLARASCMVRRRKVDVLKELPPMTRQIIEVPANGAGDCVARERAAASEFDGEIEAAELRKVQAMMSEDKEAYADAVANLTSVVRRADKCLFELAHEVALAKVPFTIEFVQDIVDQGTKVILGAHHKDVIAQFAAAWPKCALVTGDVTTEDRNKAVQRFQTDQECNPFIGSIMAAGLGLTLTAASTVVIHEPCWVPGDMSQFEARAHRMGQRDAVSVTHLVLQGSMDVLKVRALVAKQAVIDAALDTVTMPPEASEPVTTFQATAVSVTRREIDEQAVKLTQEQIEAAGLAMRMLAGMCDGALKLDGAGFNRLDAAIGHSLAERPMLTARQAVVARKLARKYCRQLPDELLKSL